MIDEIEQQLDQYARQIIEIPDLQAQTDLMRILNSCRSLVTELSREAVNCRRHQRPSLLYRELVAEYETRIEALEGFLIQATLSYL